MRLISIWYSVLAAVVVLSCARAGAEDICYPDPVLLDFIMGQASRVPESAVSLERVGK